MILITELAKMSEKHELEPEIFSVPIAKFHVTRPTRNRALKDEITTANVRFRSALLQRHLGTRKRGKVSENFRKKNNNNYSNLNIKLMMDQP